VILRDQDAALAWDGRYLPGPWLVHRAIDAGLARLESQPATKQGKVMILMCSDPNSALVAPYGGLDRVYSPNPIAAGIPTSGRPIIFDTSMSTTAMGVVRGRSAKAWRSRAKQTAPGWVWA